MSAGGENSVAEERETLATPVQARGAPGGIFGALAVLTLVFLAGGAWITQPASPDAPPSESGFG